MPASVAAVNRALDRAGFNLIVGGLRHCFGAGDTGGSSGVEPGESVGSEFDADKLEKLCMPLA
ncbi:MAG: hypothetical protein HZY75_12080 [Nocardioidaceae bacterium]|nr:MAG: hypothetical protein HZY75_12080 [Nocardioidaceae bacterium]